MTTEETEAIQPTADAERPRFGDYEILDTLGHGGFASVYRAAFHGSFGFRKQVALKVLHRRFDSVEEQASAEFLNEARLGASIRHPNLVEFYECGRVGDRLYIAMELVDGPNLAQVLQLGSELTAPLTDAVILAMAMQMARGLAGLHGATVEGREVQAVHRDFKPANILVSSLGQAKITDYGITRFAADFYQTLDQGGPRGSPLYMSPEQVRGKPLTQSSDVFAFGSTVLEMILGRPVFIADTVDGIIQQVGAADVSEALTEARARFPSLVPVLEYCMLPEPSSRYKNGAALVAGLHDVEPPPFGEELIGQVSQATMDIISRLDAKRAKRPVDRFWCLTSELKRDGDGTVQAVDVPPPVPLPIDTHDDDTDEYVAASAQPTATLPAVADASDTDEADVDASALRRWWPAALAVAAIVVAVLIAIPVVSNLSSPAPDVIPIVSEHEGGEGIKTVVEEAPTAEAPAPVVATVIPPASPPARGESATIEEPIEEPVDPEGAGPPRLFHEPVSRGIRGQSVSFQVQVEPPGSYRSTVWYRAVPDGAWQTSNVDGGAGGSLTVVIPAGVWLNQEATDVEYFIEVAGPGGLARSASAVRPYSFRLY
jgi:serine/threonine protein kinase